MFYVSFRILQSKLYQFYSLFWCVYCLDCTTEIIFSFFFKVSLFILREREREWERAGERQRERERKNLKQALHCQLSAWCGAQTHKLMRSWSEFKLRVGHLNDWATQVPLEKYFYTVLSKWLFFIVKIIISSGDG